jgi:hypothetical protein
MKLKYSYGLVLPRRFAFGPGNKCMKIKDLRQYSLCLEFKTLNDFYSRRRTLPHPKNEEKYRISKEKYDSLLEKQNGFCTICFLPQISKGFRNLERYEWAH